MQVREGRQRHPEVSSCDFLRSALARQSAMWTDVQVELAPLEPDWVTAESLFEDDAAIGEYLDFQGSFHASTDRKTCAAAMIVDYCYIFTIATVPLLVGSRIVADMSPASLALRFYLARHEHEGRILDVRRAHVRYLSAAVHTPGDPDGPAAAMPPGPGADPCKAFRTGVEMHFRPLVTRLHAKTGLSANALWRLVADAVAGRFLDAGRRFGRLEQAKALAMAILKEPRSPLFNRQLHYFDLTLRDSQQQELLSWTFRARGGCCRFYTVKPGALCSVCVLKPPAERDAELLTAMRRHLGLAADRAP